MRLVDGVAGGLQPAPTDVPITWESNHFVKGQDGITYLPFTLNIDRTKLSKADVAFYVRVVPKSDAGAGGRRPPAEAKGDAKNQPAPRPVYPWDNLDVHRDPLERQAVPRDRAQARRVRGVHRRQGEGHREAGEERAAGEDGAAAPAT